MLNGFVDGFNQSVLPPEILFQDLAMRLERSELLEISPPEDSLNLFQLKTELAIEKNLLQGQEFWLFVVSISIRAVIGGLEQARFIIEMKRAHAHA